MNFPKIVYINDTSYHIRFLKRLKYEGEDVVSLFCPDERTIFIKLGMSDSKTMQTFIHECLHAIEFEYDLKISHKLIYKMEDPILKFIYQNILEFLDLFGQLKN